MLGFPALVAALGRIPLWVWLAIGLVGLGLVYGHLRYNAGQADVQADFDAYQDKVIAATAVTKEKALQAQKAAMVAAEEYHASQKRADDAYQAGRDAAAQYQSNVVADLRADRIRLQNGWSACLHRRAEVGQAGTPSGVGDQGAGVPEEGFGRILRYAGDADNDIRFLQQTLENTRNLYEQCAKGS